MTRRWFFGFGLMLLACGLVSCSQKTNESASSMATSMAQAVSPQASPSAALRADAPGAGQSPEASVSFSDIAGDDAEQAIKDEGALGVFDVTSGPFKPNASVSRAEFVQWLVKANNAYEKDNPGKRIKLAKTGPAAFVDVPVSNPDFQYIQGLANAGYVIGVDNTHFAPNRPLTREEMIAIKAQVDEGSTIQSSGDMAMFVSQFSDANSINKRYVGMVHEDTSVRTTNNIARVWGTMKRFQPQRPVTRSETAIANSQIGDKSAAAALGRTPAPTPH